MSWLYEIFHEKQYENTTLKIMAAYCATEKLSQDSWVAKPEHTPGVLLVLIELEKA